MPLRIDHLVVAARTLDEGAAWLEERLGASPSGGGQHALMGTHNRLLGLGSGAYLEVIAVDPQAAAPARPRWFALDSRRMRARLACGPALIHWVACTDDIERDVRRAPVDLGEVVAASRGEYRWRITVPRDGSLPGEGAFPTLIQWEGKRPSERLPDAGCRLERLELRHPRAIAFQAALADLGLEEGEPVSGRDAEPGVTARIRAPERFAILE